MEQPFISLSDMIKMQQEKALKEALATNPDSSTPITERHRKYVVRQMGIVTGTSLLDDMEKIERALIKARLALQAASSALGPMENLINPDLRALKAQIEENL